LLEQPTDVAGAASVSFEVGIDADGTFSIQGVMPGRYVLSATDKARRNTWNLVQARVGGRDVLDTPVDLHAGVELSGVQLSLSDRQTELTGVLSDSAGRPVAERDLTIMPADARHQWRGSRRFAIVTTEHDGSFRLRGLPAGEYRIGRVVPATSGAALVRFPRDMTVFTTFRLADGERKVLSVTSRPATALHWSQGQAPW
jgi:hypothetical protein